MGRTGGRGVGGEPRSRWEAGREVPAAAGLPAAQAQQHAGGDLVGREGPLVLKGGVQVGKPADKSELSELLRHKLNSMQVGYVCTEGPLVLRGGDRFTVRSRP